MSRNCALAFVALVLLAAFARAFVIFPLTFNELSRRAAPDYYGDWPSRLDLAMAKSDKRGIRESNENYDKRTYELLGKCDRSGHELLFRKMEMETSFDEINATARRQRKPKRHARELFGKRSADAGSGWITLDKDILNNLSDTQMSQIVKLLQRNGGRLERRSRKNELFG